MVNFDFSKNFWSHLFSRNNSSYKLSILGVDNRIGEVVLYRRLLLALDKLGIDYYGVKFNESYSKFFFTRHFYQATTNFINYFFKPKFNLAVTHYVTILPTGVNIVYLNVPTDMFYAPNGNFIKAHAHLIEYDAYIDLRSLMVETNELLEEAIGKDSNKKIIPAYLAHNYVNYKPATINKSVITGSLWGCNRNSIRVKRALNKLAHENLLEAYGISKEYSFLGKSYKGLLEKLEGGNSKIIDNIYKFHNDNGIALLIHNFEHNLDGIPTSRLLEAAASGAIMISDNNLFIKKFFGDSVLYFDAYQDDVKIAEEVKAHIEWIKNHPEEAQVKAKEAYDIFIDNFTMEKQMKVIMQYF